MKSSAQDQPIPALDVRVTEDSGFKTFTFRILQSEFAQHPQGGELLLVWFGGRWNGRDTVMALTLDLLWEAPKEKSPFPVWLGLVGVAAAGPQSDAFVQEFRKALGESTDSISPIEDLVLETVTLGDKPTRNTRKFQMKAFRTDRSPEKYAEFYLHIDMGQREVVISEKDPEYRKALAQTFVQPR